MATERSLKGYKRCCKESKCETKARSRIKGLTRPISKIKPISEKRKKEKIEYLKKRLNFLEGKRCPVTGEKATEIHHKKKRYGKRLNDENYWMAVSRKGHVYIHDNPAESYEKGWLIKN